MDLIFTDLNTTNTKIDLKKLTTKPTSVIIGPEGDFSEDEVDQGKANQQEQSRRKKQGMV